MKKEALNKIAQGHRLMQEGYMELADCCIPELKNEQEGIKTEALEMESEIKKETPAVTIEQVRAVMAVKSQEGKTKEVKALLNKYGAEKLSGVQPEQYASLLKDAGAL